MPWINVAPILQLDSGRLYQVLRSKRGFDFLSLMRPFREYRSYRRQLVVSEVG